MFLGFSLKFKRKQIRGNLAAMAVTREAYHAYHQKKVYFPQMTKMSKSPFIIGIYSKF